MNPFFNYENRGVELPEGCKDLIDVLKLKEASSKQPAGAGLGLADLPAYVSRFLGSQAKRKSLWIHRGDWTVGIMGSDKCGPLALVLMNSAREQAVRAVFSAAGMVPSQENLLSANNMHGLQYKLSSVPDLSGFIRELLTKGFGVTTKTGLWFLYQEKDAAKSSTKGSSNDS